MKQVAQNSDDLVDERLVKHTVKPQSKQNECIVKVPLNDKGSLIELHTFIIIKVIIMWYKP